MNAPSNTTPNKAAPSTAVDGHTAELVRQLTAASLQPHRLGESTHLLVPSGHQLQDLTAAIERAGPQPQRKRGKVNLQSLLSFIEFVRLHATEQTRIYANARALQLQAVFNDHGKEHPGWQDHSATFTAEQTPELKRWLANDGKAMEQVAFAEFLEDNMADIGEPGGAALLQVATTLSAKTHVEFSSARRLDNGQVQLVYTETIDAKAAAGAGEGALSIPREFALGLRLFANGAGYALRARLKYRLNASSVKFWYELDRPERAIEDAFAGYIEQAHKQLARPILMGGLA